MLLYSNKQFPALLFGGALSFFDEMLPVAMQHHAYILTKY
jgi:hypothetical protein